MTSRCASLVVTQLAIIEQTNSMLLPILAAANMPAPTRIRVRQSLVVSPAQRRKVREKTS